MITGVYSIFFCSYNSCFSGIIYVVIFIKIIRNLEQLATTGGVTMAIHMNILNYSI